jgi:hypothetical protein
MANRSVIGKFLYSILCENYSAMLRMIVTVPKLVKISQNTIGGVIDVTDYRLLSKI